MELTLSIDDELVRRAAQRAEAMGSDINQLVREYIEGLAGEADWERDATELARLLRESKGNSGGWKFNRDEIYDRK
jgi:hypothetical protein